MAVCVNKDDLIVGHLPLGKNEKLSMIILYFLRADRYATCEVVIAGKVVNLGRGDAMQVLCTSNITGKKTMVEIRKQEISNIN